jgi:uncharacterized protein YeaO (DUF488 family)
MAIKLKRAYDRPSPADGVRVLVERLWPRGLSKKQTRLEGWLKELAPSTELRRWYHARRSMWHRFRERYLDELRAPAAQSGLRQLYELASGNKNLTLVFGSRDMEHNNAVILKELLEGMRKPPSSSGPEKAAPVAMRARARR